MHNAPPLLYAKVKQRPSGYPEAFAVFDMYLEGEDWKRTHHCDKAAFAALCGSVYDIFNDSMGSDEVLTMVQDYVASLR